MLDVFIDKNIWPTAFLSLTFTPVTIQPVQIGFIFNKAWEYNLIVKHLHKDENIYYLVTLTMPEPLP